MEYAKTFFKNFFCFIMSLTGLFYFLEGWRGNSTDLTNSLSPTGHPQTPGPGWPETCPPSVQNADRPGAPDPQSRTNHRAYSQPDQQATHRPPARQGGPSMKQTDRQTVRRSAPRKTGHIMEETQRRACQKSVEFLDAKKNQKKMLFFIKKGLRLSRIPVILSSVTEILDTNRPDRKEIKPHEARRKKSVQRSQKER